MNLPTKMAALALLTLCQLTLAMAPAEAVKPQAKEAFDQAKTYVREGNYDAAIEQLNKAIKLEPSYVDALTERGYVRNEQNNFDKALISLNRALALNSKDARALRQRAGAYYALKKYAKSVDDYSQSLALDTSRTWVWRERAKAYFQLKEYDKALQDLESFRKVSPLDVSALILRSKIHEAQGRKDLLAQDEADIKHVDEILTAYTKSVYKQAKDNWFPPKQSPKHEAVVRMHIHPDGRISNLHIFESSGSADFDKSARLAVQTVGKFSPPPHGTPNPLEFELVLRPSITPDAHAVRQAVWGEKHPHHKH